MAVTRFSLPPSVLGPLVILFWPGMAGCHRRPHGQPALPVAVVTEPATPTTSPLATPAAPPPATLTNPPPATPAFAVTAVETHEGVATWYNVPRKSLAERRAWAGEMTAASDTLPSGTYVRVRRIDPGNNGQSVVVRITDSGIHRQGTLIDLDRPAAAALGMVAQGIARVRAETLAFAQADGDKSADQRTVAAPSPGVGSSPAATRDQEQAAAAAKVPAPPPP